MIKQPGDCEFSLLYGNVFYTCNCNIKLHRPHYCLKPDLCDEFKEKR